MRTQIKHHSITVVVVLLVLAIGAGIFVYSGLYNIGADDHHTRPVFKIMQTLRDRSIHLRSKDLTVPDLEDPQLILKGAGQYAAMCTGCHLKPGMQESEIRPGLYPQPPVLSKVHVDPRDAFWIIKHGIKMSGMPAWGTTHDDPTIWSMVAFLEKLPDMSPAQYRDIVAKAPPDEDMHEHGGGHSHGGASDAGQGDEHDHEEGHEHQGGHDDHDAAGQDAGHEHKHAHKESETSISGLMQGAPALKPGAVPTAEVVARSFQRALQQGDRAAVLALLSDDVAIHEAGHSQSRDEYAAAHLGEDIAFLQAAQVTPGPMRSGLHAEQAVVESSSEIKTTSNGKAKSFRNLETLTLRKQGANWLIAAVDWRSDPEL